MIDAYYSLGSDSKEIFEKFEIAQKNDSKGKPAIIIELKWDKNADTAIKQIKERRYSGKLKEYGKEIILAGINYDKDSNDKKHECIIESITSE